VEAGGAQPESEKPGMAIISGADGRRPRDLVVMLAIVLRTASEGC